MHKVHVRKRICVLGWTALCLASPFFAQETAHHGFSDIPKWVKRFESPERAAWQHPDQVVKVLNLKPGDTVADIGAGTGYFTRRFAKAVAPGGEALGLDIEPGMVRYMQEDAARRGLSNYSARVVAPDDPGLEPGSVDLIFLCNTYHHLNHRVTYLRNLRAALKPGGRIAIVDFYRNRKTPPGPPRAVKIARSQVIREFQRAGYRLYREHKFLPYQYFLEFIPGSPDT